MSSKKGGGKNSVGHLNQGMADVSLDGNGDGWEVYGKKSRNKNGGGAAVNQEGGSSAAAAAAAAPRAWGQWPTNAGAGRSTSGNKSSQPSDFRRPAGRGNPRQQQQMRTNGLQSQYMAPAAPQPVVSGPLQHGWQWAARGGSWGSHHGCASNNTPRDASTGGHDSDPDSVPQQLEDESDDDEDDDLADSDDDDYDSDASEKSFETRKNNRWFKGFFEALDKLTIEEISEQTRQWHCPACHNGPGAIDWYKGLQPLMTHAKTKGSTRVKLHRELAELLEEDLRHRGTSVVPTGEAFGQWKGLNEMETDREIIWPPMVVIMNTLLDKDENDKWTGMGNQELVDYFSSYAAVRARHSYGPNGHRGMSVLIFEPTAMGFMEAERLHRHFQEQGTDLIAWESRRRNLFTSGGKRQLYGYLARKEDMEAFNQHSQGKSRLKYDLRSYHEMVVTQMKQMNEENQKVTYLKNKVVKEEKKSKALKETFEVVSQKLRETMEENRIVRLRTKIQHEENKEEMDFQENFFKEQMDKIRKATEEKEKNFEKLLQEERAKVRQSDGSGTYEDKKLRKEEIAKFIDSQVKGVEEFEAEREKLIRAHEDRKVKLKRKYLAEEVELEKEFDAVLTKLMEKYTPGAFQPSTSSSS